MLKAAVSTEEWLNITVIIGKEIIQYTVLCGFAFIFTVLNVIT